MLRKDAGQFLPYDKFIVKKQISQGSQGIVFMAYSHKQCSTVAVKVEKGFHKYPNLRKEITNLQILKDVEGVPKLLDFECDSNSNNNTSQFAYFSMQLLGKDLSQLLKKCGGFFSSQTVILIAIQVIQILRDIHSKGLIHRDIKPENLVLGIGQNRKRLYVIDFGTAKQFIDKNTQKHIPFQDHQPFVGTYRYSSIAPHLGYEQGRKDDLISLGYVLVYLAKGRLPWQELKFTNESNGQVQIGQLKQTTSIDELCDGLPYFFKDYFNQLSTLGFDSEPDYESLIRSAQECLENEFKTNEESPFDWAALSLNQSHACLSHQEDRLSSYSHQALFLSHNNLASSQKYILPHTNSEKLQFPAERTTDTNENYSRHVHCEDENGNGQVVKKLIPHFFKEHNKFPTRLSPILGSKSTQSIEISPELKYQTQNIKIDEIGETTSNYKIGSNYKINNNNNQSRNSGLSRELSQSKNGSNTSIKPSQYQVQQQLKLQIEEVNKNNDLDDLDEHSLMLDTFSIQDEISQQIEKQIPLVTSLSPKFFDVMKNSQGFEISPRNINKSISNYNNRKSSMEDDINPTSQLLKLQKIVQQ